MAENNGLTYIRSQKGEDLLVVDNSTFVQDRELNGKKSKCSKRVHTEIGQLVMQNVEHKHVPSPDISGREVNNKAREMASTHVTLQHVLATDVWGWVNNTVNKNTVDKNTVDNNTVSKNTVDKNTVGPIIPWGQKYRGQKYRGLKCREQKRRGQKSRNL